MRGGRERGKPEEPRDEAEATEDVDSVRHHRRATPSVKTLTEALRLLAAPVAGALAGQHGGQGELVALVAGVADAGAPGEVCADHLSVRNGGWRTAHDGYKETKV